MSLLALIATQGGTVEPPPDPAPMWTLGSPGDPVYVPAGSLDRWLAARDASATTHTDVIMVGDSVTWGQQSEATTKSPTAYLLREQALADGYLDGGDGVTGVELDHLGVRPMMAPNDPAQATYAPLTLDSGAFVTSPSQAPFGAPTMTAAGAYTIRGWGTRVDVIYRPFGGWVGTFSYSVDGGPEVEVVQVSDGTPYKQITAATGLTPGLHSVTITNKGGQTTTPVVSNVHKITGGTLPAGTYYYKVSRHNGTAESPTSAALEVSVTAGQRPRIWLTSSLGANMRIYRSTGDATGPYGLVTEGTPTASAGAVYLDVTDATTPGAAPTTPTWFYGGDAQTMVTARFTDPAKGIAWFRGGHRGTSSPAWATILPSWLSAAANPRLVIASWGINDAQQADTSGVQAATEAMIDAARAAGADVIVAVPPLRSRPYETEVRAALRAAATAKEAAVVEYAAALGPKEGWQAAGYFAGSDVHPAALGYKVMSQWLWDNLLKLGPDPA